MGLPELSMKREREREGGQSVSDKTSELKCGSNIWRP
jgi:hypothetical protein